MGKLDIRIDFINFVESPDESISYPMGILYISSYLKKNGFTNIDFTEHICLQRKIAEKETDTPTLRLYSKQHYLHAQEENPKKIIAHLKERRPHLILLGPITTYHLVELIYLVKTLREHFKEQTIIAGGPHFGKELTLDRELLEICPELDGVTVGEAEESITDVASRYYSAYINKGTPPSRTEFLSYLSETPGVLTKINELLRREPPDLDSIHAPDVGLIEDYWNSQHVTMQYHYILSKRRNPVVYTDRGYFQGEADWGYFEEDFHRFPQYTYKGPFPFGVVVGSRGCPYNCTFCCSSGRRRTHTAQQVFEQIKYMNDRYGTRTFVFFESLFTTASQNEQQRVRDFCRMLLDSRMDIEYIIDIRADIITELPDDLLAMMIRSGCIEFNIGLEKGSDQALNRVRKGTRIEQHYKAVEKLREAAGNAGREVFLNGTFILGGPGEARADIIDTVHHSWRLHLDEATFYVMQIYPGTQVYRDALREGIISPGLAPYLNVEEFPLYKTLELPLQYLSHLERANDNSRRAFSEFKKAVRELEYELTPEEKRYLSNIVLDETAKLYETFLGLIDAVLIYLARFPEEALLVGGEINETIRADVFKIEEEIRITEQKLFRRNPDYDQNIGNYQLGTLSFSLKQFIKLYNNMLKYIVI